jgi:2-polyprenyl-3-methyl-5-hydroxy-6-metoxy-1,4-benzoquinol methylase
MTSWTNEAAVEQWGAVPRELLEQTAIDGDFPKRHLINPVVLRMLGDVADRRVLDAGCGNGYLSRMLADRGADVLGVEPGQSLFDFAVQHEGAQPRGVRYVRADLCALPDLGGPFDLVVASMVLQSVPDWVGALRACLGVLRPGGLFVFTLNHPCFEQLGRSWREHGEYRTSGYLSEYEIPGPSATDFHRTLSAYVNQVVALGGQLVELCEPALPPELVAAGPEESAAYVELPNFLVVAARKA